MLAFCETFINMTYVILVRGLLLNRKFFSFFVVLLLGLTLTVAANVPPASLAATSNEPTDLQQVEIREYEGENLSSIYAFPDNSISGPQYVDTETYRLAVTGLVDAPQNYTYNDVIVGHQSYRKVVTIYCVEGWKANILWEGVLVYDLIDDAQVDPNATTVIFYAYDGYSTSFPLSFIIDNNIMLAYKMNNVTLPPEQGYPFQLVAESQFGYKWIKWVTTIELSDNDDYLGYWESRGYPNNADLGNYTDIYDFVDIDGGSIPEFTNLVLVFLALATVVAVLKVAYTKNKKRYREPVETA